MRISGAKIAEGVVVITLIAGTAWLGRQVHHNYVIHADAPTGANAAVAPLAVPAESTDGVPSELAVRDVSTAQVLLVMSTECSFCEQNMPGWVRLEESLRGLDAGQARPVVLSVDSAEETTAYLERHGLDAEVRLVDPAVLPLLGVSGYPATVAVDPQTGAIASWSGVLDDADHQALMAWAESRPGATP